MSKQMKNPKRQMLELQPTELEEILTGRARVVGLPDDLTIYKVDHDPFTDNPIFGVTSNTFPEVPEGAVIPFVRLSLVRN